MSGTLVSILGFLTMVHLYKFLRSYAASEFANEVFRLLSNTNLFWLEASVGPWQAVRSFPQTVCTWLLSFWKTRDPERAAEENDDGHWEEQEEDLPAPPNVAQPQPEPIVGPDPEPEVEHVTDVFF